MLDRLGESGLDLRTAKKFDRAILLLFRFFSTKKTPWVNYACWAEISTEELKKGLELTKSFSSCDWVIDQPELFQQAFDNLAISFQTDQLEKAVPYVFAKSHCRMTSERLKNSLKRGIDSLEKKTGHLFGYWDENSGVLGITPELLFSHSQKEPGKVSTMAVAGTCHPSHDQHAFLHDEKQRHEHQLVVRGISLSLEPLGSVKLGEIQLLQLPRLTHLLTPIEVKLRDPFKFVTLVRSLHPTPALGAFPVVEGKKWLENYQKHTPRDYYGAPIGFHYPQTGITRCLVGIRNVQWDPSGMRIGAGCGVVKQSTFEKEWQEIQFKLKAIQDQLDL